MSRAFINTSLLFILLVLGSVMVLRSDLSRPNIEYIPDMAHSPSYASFSENPIFADGKTIQPPVEGTIARGKMPLHFGKDEALRAGVELINHIPMEDTEGAARGREIYLTFCIPCHGAAGVGDGNVSLKGFPAPPSLLTGDSIDWPDGTLFHIITYGGENMPSYAAQVDLNDRWKVINYIRSIQADAKEALIEQGLWEEPVSEEEAHVSTILDEISELLEIRADDAAGEIEE